MTTTYTWANWRFNSEAWAATLNNIGDELIEAARELTGLSEAAFWHWRNNTYPEGFEHPNMTNLLKICNLLDLDPRDFFDLA